MTLKSLILTLSTELQKQQLQLITVESCTGGGLAYHLTAIPGSSLWFAYGLVPYSAQAKHNLLGISNSKLNKYGTVSPEIALNLAYNALKQARAMHIAAMAIAITGIAGPTGATATRAVGTIYFAWQIHNGASKVIAKFFSGTRHSIRQQALRFAIEQAIVFLKWQ